MKDELRKIWVETQSTQVRTEKDKRMKISEDLKATWYIMANKNISTFWEKAGLQYPQEDVEYNIRRRQRGEMEEENSVVGTGDVSQNSQMEIE